MYPFSFYNGKFIRYEELNVHISDLGLQRGYGIFDFFEIIDGKIRWKDDYFQRFFNSLEIADIRLGITSEELEFMIEEIISLNKSQNSFVKLIATGGPSDDGFTPADAPGLFILNMPKIDHPEDDYAKGVNLILLKYLRPHPQVKSLNYMASLMSRAKMSEFNAKDVLYHFDGQVSETSRANIFMVKKGHIFTPGNGVLKGVTRKHLIQKLDGLFPVAERDVQLDELLSADEVFMTSTTKYIMPVVKIENTTIGSGQVGTISQKLISMWSQS